MQAVVSEEAALNTKLSHVQKLEEENPEAAAAIRAQIESDRA